VLLQGEPPRLAGWRIIARLRHQPAGTVVEPRPAASWTASAGARWARAASTAACAAGRVQTYLLEHRSGWLAQVGSGCLRDFTGHDPARALLQAGYLAAAAALGGAAFAAPRAEK
jgi:hypothetical protein